MFRRLMSPRYVAFALLMVAVATVCITLGVWQVARFAQKRAENHDLRANAHATATSIASLLRPVGAPDAARTAKHNQFRTATVSGTYDTADQLLVRGQQVGDTNALLVLTPLRTDDGVLLVVRGWLPADAARPATPAAPPSDRVDLRVRVQTSDTRGDHFGREPSGQVRSINAVDAARRLEARTYDGYGELLSRQPGTARLSTMPAPDLSNPAGGAVEPQHLAYIAQWFLFAGLALAAPPVMARAESRREDEPPAGTAEAPTDTGDDPAAAAPDPERARRDRLADRYGAARRF